MMRAPISSLIWRQAETARALRREIDTLRSELAVAKTRERRWRWAAHALAAQVGPNCAGGPRKA